MCVDWIELFVRTLLISLNPKIHVSWKDVLHQLVKSVLTLTIRKKNIYIYILCIWPKLLVTYFTIKHTQYLKDVSLRTARYSCRLSTAGKDWLFTESVNSTNITVHIFQCVTVMNLDILQHFPPASTSTSLSHTRVHLTYFIVWIEGLPCADALIFLCEFSLSLI